MVVLQNGLRLAALPAELAGILTGGLLVGAIGLPALRRLLQSDHQRGGGSRGRDAELSAGGALRRHPGGRADRRRQQLVAGALAPSRHGPSAASPAAGSTSDNATVADAVVVGMMPKAKGDPYFVSCRQGADRSRGASERRADLGWPDGARSGEAERGRRSVDHARRQRRRGQRREPGGDLHRAAKGAIARHQGADVGRRLGARRARLPGEPGDAAGHRRNARRRSGAPRRRRWRVRDRHGVAERGQSEPVDRVHQGADRRQIPRTQAGRDPAQRRRPRSRVRRNPDHPQGVSEGAG